MILRSLTKHVKDQNWFAVWIDFTIVVVGVFIGIQVANWNETRAEAAQTQRILSTVLSDFAAIRGKVANDISQYSATVVSIDALMTALEAGEATQPEEILKVFEQATTVRSLPPAPAGLDELLVAARLDLLGQAPLRDALRALAQAVSYSAGAEVEYRKYFDRAIDVLYRYGSIARTPELENNPFSVNSVDIEGVWSNPEARIALMRLYVFHSTMRNARRYLLQAIDAVLAEAALDREP